MVECKTSALLIPMSNFMNHNVNNYLYSVNKRPYFYSNAEIYVHTILWLKNFKSTHILSCFENLTAHAVGNKGCNFGSVSVCLYVVTWASYQIRKIAGCACAGNAGNVFPRRRFQRKLLVSDPGMHHGTCVTHVPWCMSGSLTCGDGENVPGIPSACAPAILRIWQEAH